MRPGGRWHRDRVPPPPVLVLRTVSKAFHAGLPGCLASVAVLERADLVVRAGERVALLGPPASGKTTLLLLAAGLLTPDRGEIWRLPGSRLSLGAGHGATRRAAAVSEPAPGPAARPMPDRLAWCHRAARGAMLVEVPAGGAVPPWASRVLEVRRGTVAELASLPAASSAPRLASGGSAR